MLFIEVLLVGGKLVFLQHTAFEPRHYEASAIAHELDKGGGHTEQAHPKAAVLDGRVDKDDERIKKQGE